MPELVFSRDFLVFVRVSGSNAGSMARRMCEPCLLQPSPRYQMDGSDTMDGSVLTLVIPKATAEDDGLYRCSAVSIAGSVGQVARIQLPGKVI